MCAVKTVLLQELFVGEIDVIHLAWHQQAKC